jgi:hypothetical protein
VSKATEFFDENIDVLYVDSEMPTLVITVIYIFGIVIFGFIAYKSAEVYFRDE